MSSDAAISIEALTDGHHDVLARLRADAPVAWLDVIGGWVVTSRDLAASVMRDPESFTVDDPRFSTARVIGPSMLSLDGHEHARHRDPFAAAYRPAEVVARHADAIVATARRLVAAVAPTGRAELRRELAGPLAVGVVGMSLGLDDLDPIALLGWYDRIVAAVEEVSAGQVSAGQVSAGEAVAGDGALAFAELGAALDGVARRPGSVLEGAAQVLSRDELVSNAAVFLFGGIETSEGMTANLLGHLMTNPQQLQRVRDDRALVDAAVDESLRLEPAAARVDRYATLDIDLAGVQVRRGDLVVVSLAAANRDPTVYADPDRFDVGRTNARTHLAFARGPHACIGAQLARMEARAAVDAVLDLLPVDIHLVDAVATSGLVFRKARSVGAGWTPAATTPAGP